MFLGVLNHDLFMPLKIFFLAISAAPDEMPLKVSFHLGKFKKNVTFNFFYPHALNMEYFYLNLSRKDVF